mmetsp:Transcript_1325/g.4082  ORF Transcript_1325/g.4082 Transcript_1325/m.4082 type:complete len:221 (-) Transcript_1325:770-1432(-)
MDLNITGKMKKLLIIEAHPVTFEIETASTDLHQPINLIYVGVHGLTTVVRPIDETTTRNWNQRGTDHAIATVAYHGHEWEVEFTEESSLGGRAAREDGAQLTNPQQIHEAVDLVTGGLGCVAVTVVDVEHIQRKLEEGALFDELEATGNATRVHRSDGLALLGQKHLGNDPLGNQGCIRGELIHKSALGHSYFGCGLHLVERLKASVPVKPIRRLGLAQS